MACFRREAQLVADMVGSSSLSRAHGMYYVTYRSISKQPHAARQLALKVVSSNQLSHPQEDFAAGVPDDDPLGDELRDCVTKGFMLQRQLSMLQDIHENDFSSRIHDRKGRLVDHVNTFLWGEPTLAPELAEESLLWHWSEYKRLLQPSDLVDLRLTFECVRGKLVYENCLLSTKTPLWIDVKATSEPVAINWLLGFLYRQHPTFLQRLWSENTAIATNQAGLLRRLSGQRGQKAVVRQAVFPSRLSRAPDPRPDTQQNGLVISPANTVGEADCFYKSTYCSRRGRLPDSISRRRQLLIRKADYEHQSNFNVCTIGWRPRPEGGWKKQRLQNKIAPKPYYDPVRRE
ncbi:MAG: hypothetical protein Q9220_002428 [cf. Caloplaca sp. 1 TL-2023]